MDGENLELVPEPERTSFRQLITRCEKAGIEYELAKLGLRTKENDYFLRILLPIGRDKRIVYVFDLEDAQKISQVEFEKYVFIEGYEAICSYQDGFIEAYIKLIRRAVMVNILFSRLLNIPVDKIRKMKRKELVFAVESPISTKAPIAITISQPTKTMLALSGREPEEGASLTIKVKDLEISNNQEASTILEKLANAFFFGIRNTTGIPLMLEPYYGESAYPRIPILLTRAAESLVAFPIYQYDAEPLNLYWYASTAYEMPLLQFLAYYQVLEFYFPIYAGKEVRAELANILKDPQFNPDHHLDINKVISAVLSKMGRGYGDERSQIRATIRGCAQDREVRELIERDNIKEHFKSDYKKLSTVKVSVQNKDLDLREQLADRLYDIRCKIVHTKAEEAEKGHILPFTREENLLTIEVPIIEFIARKAIIAGSKKLSI